MQHISWSRSSAELAPRRFFRADGIQQGHVVAARQPDRVHLFLIQCEETPMHLIRAGQVCEDRGARGQETDTLAADAAAKDEDLCLPWVGGKTCCRSSDFKMTFYSDFTIQIIQRKASPDRSYVMWEAELLIEDYSFNCRESFHLMLYCAVYTHLPPPRCLNSPWWVEVRLGGRQFCNSGGKCVNLNQ